MPLAPKKECSGAGCHILVTPPLYQCQKCKKVKQVSVKSVKVKKWLNSARYKKQRLRRLRIEPLCRTCKKKSLLVAGSIYDHVVPHKGSYKLFWDFDNSQTQCVSCHNRKTAVDDGGFGR